MFNAKDPQNFPQTSLSSTKTKRINWIEISGTQKLDKGGFGSIHTCTYKNNTVILKTARTKKLKTIHPNQDIFQTEGGLRSIPTGTYQNNTKTTRTENSRKTYSNQDVFQIAKSVLQHEADTMALLSPHPHIVSIYGMTTDYQNNKTYIVMEYMPGGSLLRFINYYKDYYYGSSFEFDVANDIACGLQHMHSKGIIHRDLKSANILITVTKNKYIAKIADFGISLHVANITKETKPRLVGTTRYIAPETFREGKYSKKTDIYSYGLILWELLTHKMPYEDLEDRQEITNQIINYQIPAIPTIEEVLQIKKPKTEIFQLTIILNIIKQCLAQNSIERPSSAQLVEYYNTRRQEPKTLDLTDLRLTEKFFTEIIFKLQTQTAIKKLFLNNTPSPDFHTYLAEYLAKNPKLQRLELNIDISELQLNEIIMALISNFHLKEWEWPACREKHPDLFPLVTAILKRNSQLNNFYDANTLINSWSFWRRLNRLAKHWGFFLESVESNIIDLSNRILTENFFTDFLYKFKEEIGIATLILNNTTVSDSSDLSRMLIDYLATNPKLYSLTIDTNIPELELKKLIEVLFKNNFHLTEFKSQAIERHQPILFHVITAITRRNFYLREYIERHLNSDYSVLSDYKKLLPIYIKFLPEDVNQLINAVTKIAIKQINHFSEDRKTTIINIIEKKLKFFHIDYFLCTLLLPIHITSAKICEIGVKLIKEPQEPDDSINLPHPLENDNLIRALKLQKIETWTQNFLLKILKPLFELCPNPKYFTKEFDRYHLPVDIDSNLHKHLIRLQDYLPANTLQHFKKAESFSTSTNQASTPTSNVTTPAQKSIKTPKEIIFPGHSFFPAYAESLKGEGKNIVRELQEDYREVNGSKIFKPSCRPMYKITYR